MAGRLSGRRLRDAARLRRISCETRLALVGEGYELVIREGKQARVKLFADLPTLLARGHELLTAWKATGWSNEDGAYGSLRWAEVEG